MELKIANSHDYLFMLVCATAALRTGLLSLLKLGRTLDRLDLGKCYTTPDILCGRQSNLQRDPWRFSSLKCKNMCREILSLKALCTLDGALRS